LHFAPHLRSYETPSVGTLEVSDSGIVATVVPL
jgi:hypothetical protein